jgi:hypothetical protein
MNNTVDITIVMPTLYDSVTYKLFTNDTISKLFTEKENSYVFS